MNIYSISSQLDIENHLSKKFKRKLTEQECHILSFAFKRGIDTGKQQLLHKIVENLTKEDATIK